MRLEHFQYIVEIARCKSMSKASKKLFITQPSLSTAIQGLETELGFQIFKRSASGVALTDKGESLLHIAEDVVFQLEQIKELSDPDNATTVTINVAAVPVFCNALMMDLIQQLHRDYPFINLNILELRPCKILPTLIAGTADIAIGCYQPSTKQQILQEANKNGFSIEPVFQDKMVCFLPRNHPLARHKKVTFLELQSSGLPGAVYNDHVLMDSFDCISASDIPETEVGRDSYSFTDRSSIKKAVSKGLAFTTLPRLMAYDDIYVTSGMIIPVPLADTNLQLTMFLAYPARGNLSHASTVTLNAVRTLFQKIATLFADQDRNTKEAETQSINNQFLVY
jgi:DNA-binding transcriptional LysR family regulator